MRQLAAHRATLRHVVTPRGPLAVLDTAPDGGPSEHPPALLVPGYTGSKEDFAPVVDPLVDAGYRVVALDMRGQFESPPVADPAAYTVEALAEDLALVVDDLSAGRTGGIHLLGHSFGGLVARRAALARPSAFASLTLLASGPGGLVGARAERLSYMEPLLAQAGIAGVYDVLERLGQADPRWLATPQPVRDFLRRRFLASSTTALNGMADAMLGEPDRVAELRRTGLPVLVAHGPDDDAWAPEDQTDMASRLGARHVVIPGSIHSPAIENPDATVATLREFWADTEAGSTGR